MALLEGQVHADHPALIVPLNNLATSLLRSGRLEEAGGAYRRAIAICGSTLGPDHAMCGGLFGNYSLVLRKLGRKREAKQMTARSQQIELASQRRNGVGTVVSVETLR